MARMPAAAPSCPMCGVPADAKVFDESAVHDLDLRPGDAILLARFELPPEYCGTLEYIALDRILNPWGNGSFQIAIRLDDSAVLEFSVRRIDARPLAITAVGGRIVGRYWYNAAYGDVAWRRS